MELAIMCYGHRLMRENLAQASFMGLASAISSYRESIAWANLNFYPSPESPRGEVQGGACDGPETKRRKVRFADESPSKLEDGRVELSTGSGYHSAKKHYVDGPATVSRYMFCIYETIGRAHHRNGSAWVISKAALAMAFGTCSTHGSKLVTDKGQASAAGHYS